jgi:superfamily II RNA helicase
MDFHYDFILKAIHSNKHDFNNIFELSYYEYQNVSTRNELKKEIDGLIQNQNKLSLSDYLADLKEKYEIEQTLKICAKDTLKQHQTKLNTWNNKHVGPRWLEASKKFPQWLTLENSVKMKTNSLEMLGTTPLHSNIDYLHYIGFMENNSLTLKGILATEINEMNSLITVTAYENTLFESLSPLEILCIVSIFDNYRSNVISEPTQMDVYRKFEAIRDELSSLEIVSSPDEYWHLTSDWMNPIMDWANGQEVEAICQTYELFPGNLIRVVMSVQNAIDELISIATYTSNVSLLEKLTEAKQLLVRNVLVADSLYLRN